MNQTRAEDEHISPHWLGQGWARGRRIGRSEEVCWRCACRRLSALVGDSRVVLVYYCFICCICGGDKMHMGGDKVIHVRYIGDTGLIGWSVGRIWVGPKKRRSQTTGL